MASKEAVHFDVDRDVVPQECWDIVSQLKDVAERHLFIWGKDFDVTPPPPFFDNTSAETVRFDNIFVVPDFDESEELSRAADSREVLRLNSAQLSALRRDGEFEVDSRRFPGQRHRWRLNRLLQKGTANTRASLQGDVVRGLQMLFVTARNRWCARGFSIRQALSGFVKGTLLIVDLLIGLPHTNCGDLNIILERELQHFLVCELSVKGSLRPKLEEFWNFLERVVCMTPEERYNHANTQFQQLELVRPPFSFLTPSKVAVDLRLHCRHVFGLVEPVVKELLQTAHDDWFIDFRDKLVKELRKTGKELPEIAETVNRTCLKEFHNRLFARVRESEALQRVEPAIGETLVRQARFYIICREADAVWNERLEQEDAGIVNEFRRRAPLRSQMAPCLRAHREQALAAFQAENHFAKCEYALQRCVEAGLEQHAYFLSRLLQFWRERVPLLEKQVRATRQTFPDNVFTFRRKIWFPQNWVVRQSMFGIVTKIDTEVLDKPIEAEIQREQAHYTVHKEHEHQASTRYPFWRWKTFVLRHFVFMMNVMGLLLIKFPFSSRFGARALFSSQPFYARYTHCSYARFIYPDTSRKVQTFVSRMSALWRHVRSSRRKFESSPNTGLIDKRMTRHLNRFWNYVLKGACGSVLLSLFFPPLSLLLTFFSFLFGVTAVLWTPIVSLLYQLVFITFIYDRNKPSSRRNAFFPMLEAVIYHWLIRGVLQLVLAALTSVLFCPLLTLFILVGGAIRFSVRSVWDAFMFHAVVKRHARVPAKSDWVARRVAGPGIASNNFYQARPEQMLAALLARLEREHLELWFENKRREIAEPMDEFEKFMKNTLSCFSMATNKNAGVLKQLQEQRRKLRDKLSEERTKRSTKLQVDVDYRVRHRIKLTINDLDVVTRSGTKLVESFYRSQLQTQLQLRPAGEDSWWEEKEMVVHDFDSLFTELLGEEFGEQVFTPLEESDTFYELHINHIDLSGYVQMLTDAEVRDDLDEAWGLLKEPQRLRNLLRKPQLDFEAFSPNMSQWLPPLVRSEPLYRRRHKARKVMRFAAVKNKFSNVAKKGPRPDSLAALAGPVVPVSFKIYHPGIIALLLHKRDRSDHSPSTPLLPQDDPFLRDVLEKVWLQADDPNARRTVSLGSVNPDLVQSATTNSSPQRLVMPSMASEVSLSVGTTEEDDDEAADEGQALAQDVEVGVVGGAEMGAAGSESTLSAADA